PDDLPDSCNTVTAWLKEQGALTDDVVEQRARLALRSGAPRLARQLAGSLPSERSEPIVRTANLLLTPEPEIKKLIASPQTTVEYEALLDAFSRLARKDSIAALELYKPLVKSRDLGHEQRVAFERALALGLALDRKPEAVEHYDDLPE